MTKTVINTSSNMNMYDTGAVRECNPDQFDIGLIPQVALYRLAVRSTVGAVKYSDHNWRKGIPYMRYYNACLRHLLKWLMRYNDEDHLAAALWNIAALLETEHLVKKGDLPFELDDRLYYDDDTLNVPDSFKGC